MRNTANTDPDSRQQQETAAGGCSEYFKGANGVSAFLKDGSYTTPCAKKDLELRAYVIK